MGSVLGTLFVELRPLIRPTGMPVCFTGTSCSHSMRFDDGRHPDHTLSDTAMDDLSVPTLLPTTPSPGTRFALALDELHRPSNLHRVLDRLSRRTLCHMSLQRPRYLVLRGPCRQTDRVVHIDLRQQNDPVHYLVRAFSRTTDITVRNCNPAHLQCAIECPE
jgi:hypothetical protein